jgi:hypothetical protein
VAIPTRRSHGGCGPGADGRKPPRLKQEPTTMSLARSFANAGLGALLPISAI